MGRALDVVWVGLNIIKAKVRLQPQNTLKKPHFLSVFHSEASV